MSQSTLSLTPPLHRYLLEHSLREPAILARLRAVTAGLPMANMQIAPEQGQFLQLLVRILGARRCLEIGTFCCWKVRPAPSTSPSSTLTRRITAPTTRRSWTCCGRAG